MEVAFSQMQDTLSQLRQAQSREIAKIEQETEQLEQYVLGIILLYKRVSPTDRRWRTLYSEKILRMEAEILSKALSARLAAGPPSSEELLRWGQFP